MLTRRVAAWIVATVAVVSVGAITVGSASVAGAQSLGDRLAPPSRGPRGGARPVEPRADPSRAPEWPSWGEAAAPRPRYGAGSPGGPPPDLVLTRDGGMVRGTIVRSQPGRMVEVRLSTGDVQRISWSDVRYAGRAEGAPVDGPAPGVSDESPGQGRATSGIRVRFESSERLTLHRVSASATSRASHGFTTVHGRSELYERECTAPCVLNLEPGVYQLGLSIGATGPLAVGAFDLDRPGTLRGIHVDNAGVRAAGGVLLALSLITAGLAVPLSFMLGTWGPDLTTLLAGSIAGGVGVLLSIPFLAARSGLALRFE